MAELPDDMSKRELEAWLAENVRGEEVCHKTRAECEGCERMVYKGLTEHVGVRGMETGSEVVRHYTTDREAALDLLEVFIYDTNYYYVMTQDDLFLARKEGEQWIGARENFDTPPKIDPLAVSVAIYKAFKQTEEANNDS